MDALVPLASLPAPMSGRNWMLRRMLIDAIVTDPAWKGGDYVEQPPNLRIAAFWFGTATSGGSQRLQGLGPTGREADAYVDKALATQKVGDANDTLFQWSSSRDFDPSADLDKIAAPLLAINSVDDERNPPELRVFEREMKRIPKGKVYMIPASAETSGHGTTGSMAHLFAQPLAAFLKEVPKRQDSPAGRPVSVHRLDHVLHHLLRVAEHHHRLVHIEQLVVQAGVAGGHGALVDDDAVSLVCLQDRHAGDG